MSFAPADLTVVIPTRDRWPVVAQTLKALAGQTVSGFDVVVVVDGRDQPEPPAPPAELATRWLTQDRTGPGGARNAAVGATRRPLVLFLGDDMLPEPNLVERHLARHTEHPEDDVAVLGRVEWHRDVRRSALVRWIDRSHSQFDFPTEAGTDAGWGRFYSCNISMKRTLFCSVGGFDAEFRFDYEDLDLGYRLSRCGITILYEPAALANHLHHYDLARLTGRYRSRGEAEWQMAAKHDWFEPFFGTRARHADRQTPVSEVWPRLSGVIPERLLPRRVRDRTDLWFHQAVAPHYLDGWAAARDLDDLKTYLGAAYDQNRLHAHQSEVEAEEEAAPDEVTFYRTSNSYLYDLTAFGMMGVKTPYRMALRRFVPTGGSLLDYGCGTGSDGLRFAELGYEVAFADFDNPSTRFLRWRLERRGIEAPVYDIERDVPKGFDAAYSFDVIEHVDDPFAFLAGLEARAEIVCVNLLEPDPADPHMHRPLPIPEILSHARGRGLLHHQIHHGRSHLVIYRSAA